MPPRKSDPDLLVIRCQFSEGRVAFCISLTLVSYQGIEANAAMRPNLPVLDLSLVQQLNQVGPRTFTISAASCVVNSA